MLFTRRNFLWSTSFSVLAAVDRGRMAEAETLVETHIASGKLRAACLLVRQGNSPAYEKAFGSAGNIDAKFLIASISKPMTATAVMKLVDRGKLKIEDPASRYLPELGSDGDRGSITVRNLLTHTSGLPDMLPDNTALRRKNAPLSEFVTLGLKTPLLFKPGTKTSYSSTAILLASEIVRRIDGRPFPKFMDEEVYQPLGMTNTAMGLGRFPITEAVRSQTEYADADLGAGSDAASWDWNSPYWRNLATPWGGAHSTVRDIDRFLRAFLPPGAGKPLLKPETSQAMIRNQNEGLNQPYGIGWSVGRGFGKGSSPSTFGHGGSTGTLCWADPERKLTFVMLTSLPDRVARKLVISPVSDLASAAAV